MHCHGPLNNQLAYMKLPPLLRGDPCCGAVHGSLPRILTNLPQGDGNLPLSIQRTIFNLCVPLVLGFLAAVFWLLW